MIKFNVGDEVLIVDGFPDMPDIKRGVVTRVAEPPSMLKLPHWYEVDCQGTIVNVLPRNVASPTLSPDLPDQRSE